MKKHEISTHIYDTYIDFLKFKGCLFQEDFKYYIKYNYGMLDYRPLSLSLEDLELKIANMLLVKYGIFKSRRPNIWET